MSTRRKTFAVSLNIYDKIKFLSDEEVGSLFKSLLRYANNKKYVLKNDNRFMVDTFFDMVDTMEIQWMKPVNSKMARLDKLEKEAREKPTNS